MTEFTNYEKLAIELYKPPFSFRCGYIFDANGNMVGDQAGESAAMRIRGWGRISYMDNPEKLQDTVGEIMAKALTEFWEKYQ